MSIKITLTLSKVVLIVILICAGLGCHYLGEQTIGSTPTGKALIEAGDTINCIRFIIKVKYGWKLKIFFNSIICTFTYVSIS